MDESNMSLQDDHANHPKTDWQENIQNSQLFDLRLRQQRHRNLREPKSKIPQFKIHRTESGVGIYKKSTD